MNDKKSDGQMKFSMPGEDAATELEKLEKYTGEVGWEYLEKHYKTGALLYVDPSLDIVMVGKAISEDDTEKVANWKKNGDLLQPSTPHAYYWEKAETRFTALVVSPFVLIQPIGDS